ncbi:MAG: sialidase family protein, partial [Chloroflexota bacterium]
CWLAALLVAATAAAPDAQGSGWTPPAKIFAVTQGAVNRVAIVANSFGRLYALWDLNYFDAKDGKLESIEYWISRWDGQSWSKPVNVLFAPYISRVSVLADEHNEFHVFYMGTQGCLNYLWVRDADMLSPAAWSKPRCIDHGGQSNISAAMDTASPTMCVVRIEPDAEGVRVLCSANYGATWKSGRPISAPDSQVNNALPSIAFGRHGRLHLAWSPATAPSGYPLLGVLYSYSDDLGQNWSKISTLGVAKEGDPRVVTSDQYVYVVWSGDAAKRGRYVQFSADDGETWAPRQTVVPPAPDGKGGLQGPPPLVIDNAREAHVILHDQDVLTYRRKSVATNQWSPPTQLYIPGQGGVGGEIFWPVATVYNGNELHLLFALSEIGVFHQKLNLTASYEAPQPMPSPAPLSVNTRPALSPTPADAPRGSVVSGDPPPDPNAFSQQNVPLVAALLPVVALIGVLLLARLVRR